jgi:hypothetical protein
MMGLALDACRCFLGKVSRRPNFWKRLRWEKYLLWFKSSLYIYCGPQPGPSSSYFLRRVFILYFMHDPSSKSANIDNS